MNSAACIKRPTVGNASLQGDRFVRYVLIPCPCRVYCNNPAPVNCIMLLVPVALTFPDTAIVPVPIVTLCPVPPAEPLVKETLTAFNVPDPTSRTFTPGEVA